MLLLFLMHVRAGGVAYSGGVRGGGKKVCWSK